MQDCVFCKIINREIPSDIVYEDEHILAFKDSQPVAPTHLLFIPKKHIPTFFELQQEDSNILGALQLAAVKVAKDMGLTKQGFRLVANCQKDAGQTVWHLHYHFLAGRPFQWPPG